MFEFISEYFGVLILVIAIIPALIFNWHFLNRGPWSTLVKDYPLTIKNKVLAKDKNTLTTWIILGNRKSAFNNLVYGKTHSGLYLSVGWPTKRAYIPFEEIAFKEVAKIWFSKRHIIGFKNSDVKLAMNQETCEFILECCK